MGIAVKKDFLASCSAVIEINIWEGQGLNDVVVMGCTFKKHLRNLQMVFNRFRVAKLKLNTKKCAFLWKKVVFLGHTITADGIQTSKDTIKAIRD